MHVDRASILLCSDLLYLIHVLTLPYSHGSAVHGF